MFKRVSFGEQHRLTWMNKHTRTARKIRNRITSGI